MTELIKRLRNMADEPGTSRSAAALMREAAGEIDRLTRERDEARAAYAALWEAASFFRSMALCGEGPTKRSEEVSQVFKRVNPGQPLLDELDRLRRLEAAVVNREFVWQCPWTDCEDTTYCQDAICAALLAAMKGE